MFKQALLLLATQIGLMDRNIVIVDDQQDVPKAVQAPPVHRMKPVYAEPLILDESQYRSGSMRQDLNQRQRRKLLRQVPQLRRKK